MLDLAELCREYATVAAAAATAVVEANIKFGVSTAVLFMLLL